MFSIQNFILALTLAAPSFTPTPDQAAEKIECKLVLCPDSAFEDRWTHTPASAGVHLPETHSVVRKQYFSAVLFLTKFPADEQVLEYDIRMTKPDGGVYFEQEDLEGFNIGKASHGSVLCARATVNVCFEPEDALGAYVTSVVIHDKQGKTAATAEEKIELVEYVEGKGFKDREELTAWLPAYLHNQQPERAIPGFLEYCKEGGWGNDSTLAHGFFDELFRRNDWLFPLLLEKYQSASAECRRQILGMLARSKYDAQSFLADCNDEDRTALDKLRAEPRSDPLTEPIASREHLNELYGVYFASGAFAPIYRMCEALAPEETGAVADGNVVKTGGEQGPPLRTVVPTVLNKKLLELVSYDKLVAQYCEWIVDDDETPKGVRDAVKELLEKK